MADKHLDWSLDNWPETWDHDTWDDRELRRLSQQAMGHHAIYEFFKRFPEFSEVADFLFEKRRGVTWWFFWTLVLIVRLLSQLSKDSEAQVSAKATNLLERIFNYVDDNNELFEIQPEKYSYQVGEEFAEAFWLIGDEQENIEKYLSAYMKNLIEQIERAEEKIEATSDTPELNAWLIKREQPVVDLVERIVRNMK